MKQLQTLIIVFCLGLFLVPKDNFYAKASQDNCCKNEQMSSCCKDKSSNQESHKNGKSSCKDDCCNFCATCFSVIETPFSKSLHLEISYYKANKNLQFQYSDPYISNRSKDIWQPPKLV